MKAIVVRYSGGYIEKLGAAEVEDWQAVQVEADRTEYVERLVGWGAYTTLYVVYAHRAEQPAYYMVEHEA